MDDVVKASKRGVFFSLVRENRHRGFNSMADDRQAVQYISMSVMICNSLFFSTYIHFSELMISNDVEQKFCSKLP